MKKSILVAIAAISIYPCLGQNLETRVPTASQYVLTVNAPNILSKMSVAEMEELPLVNKTVSEFVRDRKHYDDFDEEDKNLRMNDLGFDFSNPSYFFVEAIDSITFTGYLIELNNQSKFEALNDTSMKWMKNTKNLKIIGGRNKMVAWNKTTALFISGDVSSSYFKDHMKIYAQYGIEIDTTDYKYNYYNFYAEQDKIKQIWLQKKVEAIFSKKSKKSAKASFLAYKDNTAALTMWSSPKKLYANYLGTFLPLTSKQAKLPGEDLVYHLYLNEKDANLKSVLKLTDKDRKSYENMFDNPLNPKFFTYIDTDKNLSYYSYNYSIQGVLEEVPYVVSTYLGASFDKWGIQESIDLLSVVLDEEAIGKVIVGDGILVLTDITSKEVTYTDYEWDENYINRTEVTKTKEEIVPEFLYMLSTKDEGSINKIFSLAMKNNSKLIKEEGYYSLELYKNAPFKLYFVVRDGIVFMCNGEGQLQDILTNKKVKPLAEAEIKKIAANPFEVYLDGKKIMNKIPTPKGDTKRDEKNRAMLIYAKENIGSLAIKQSLVEKGLVLDATYTFANNAQNSLKYFLHFFNDLYEIGEGK